MKTIPMSECRAVEGGAKYSYTAKCSVCGKKFKVTTKYYGLISYIINTNSAKIAAQAKARDCAYADISRW